MDSEKLITYFKSDKSDWYVNDGNELKWKAAKVSEFWHEFHSFVVKSIISDSLGDIESFIFPKSSNHALKLVREGKILQKYSPKSEYLPPGQDLNDLLSSAHLVVRNCTFLDIVELQFFSRFESVTFQDCKFNAHTIFDHSSFKKLRLIHCRFSSFSMINTSFKDELYISNCNLGSIKISASTDVKRVFIRLSNFNGLSKITGISVSDELIIEDSNFERLKFKIYPEKNLKVNLIRLNRRKNLPGIIEFQDQVMFDSFLIQDCPLNQFVFNNSNISDARFYYCDFVLRNRLIIGDENLNYEEETGFEATKELKKQRYERLERIYRSFKKSYDRDMHYEYSSYASISELDMRRERLYLERKCFEHALYKYYKLTSDYSQSFIKPLIWLFVTIFLFSVLYYPIDCNVLRAVQRGIVGALPFIDIDIQGDPFRGFWLILSTIEFIIGTSLTTFFLFALRKRFR